MHYLIVTTVVITKKKIIMTRMKTTITKIMIYPKEIRFHTSNANLVNEFKQIFLVVSCTSLARALLTSVSWIAVSKNHKAAKSKEFRAAQQK